MKVTNLTPLQQECIVNFTGDDEDKKSLALNNMLVTYEIRAFASL